MQLIKPVIFFSACILLWASCTKSGSEIRHETSKVILGDYEVIVSFDDEVLANPRIIKFDGNSNLLIYDAGLEKLVVVNRTGDVIREIGRKGRGPGEFQSVSNLNLVNDHIYLIDNRQYLIHRYNLNGKVISSMDYGVIGIHYVNKPYVTKNGDVLISPAITDQSIFKLVKWNGNQISAIGHVPEGATHEIDYNLYREAVSSRTVPAFFYSNAFAINDDARPNEYFLVYEAFPKVAKYNTEGERLWITEPANVPELDSIATNYYDFMDMILRQANAIQPLRKYISGMSHNGNLYLSTHANNSPLWVHKYNGEGSLIKRFQLASDVRLSSHIDIDFENQMIFVITEEAEIRAYPF